jgi:uncharacterized protein (DUF1697 family)
MKYVAFLRAINVGGHAIIKMTDLKKMFESAGLANVQTYIQSGNVIFESDEVLESFAQQIERQLEKAAEYKIEVFVRTMREVQAIAEKPPFQAQADETVFVSFLNNKPDKKSQQAVLDLKSDADEFAFKGRELYCLRRDREKSIFSGNLVEKLLKIPTTTRNLTTITKIVEKYK